MEDTLKGKNLLPEGSQFFPLRVAPIEKGQKSYHVKVISLGVHPFPLSTTAFYKTYSAYLLGSFDTNCYILFFHGRMFKKR